MSHACLRPSRPPRHDRLLDHNIAAADDQADGLRRMFAGSRLRFVPVVSNPHVAFGGVLLERLCTAFAERGASTLVVDAAERAGPAGEMALIDLGAVRRAAVAAGLPTSPRAACRSASSTRTARPAPSCSAIAEAAPRVHVVLVHASAPRAVPAVLAAPHGSAAPRCRARSSSPRTGRQRHPRLRGDEAAGAARRPVVLRPGARRRAEVAARRAHRRQAGDCADSFFGARAARLGPRRPGRRGHRRRPAWRSRRLVAHRLGAEPMARPMRPTSRPTAATGHAFS